MVSGGGDSVALLHLLWLWGRRPLEVFCVDHGLNPQSADWTRRVERLCDALGVGFTPLLWEGAKPANGIQAAARRARHGLINAAAQAKSIQVLCVGHTLDDAREAQTMRGMGSNVGLPRAWGPAPLWPEGRGLFYLRPLMGQSRARLRQWLEAAGIDWIDDPANENETFLRVRARRERAVEASVSPEAIASVPLLPPELVPEHLEMAAALRFSRAALLRVPEETARFALACAGVCAGGGARLPKTESVAALYRAVKQGVGTVQTLSGARFILTPEHILIGRDSGEFTRKRLGPVKLEARHILIWDGRFEIRAGDETGDILPLKGLGAHLAARDMQSVKALPAALRASVAVWRAEEGRVCLLPLGGRVESLVFRRFCAHAGLWRTEAEIQT